MDQLDCDPEFQDDGALFLVGWNLNKIFVVDPEEMRILSEIPTPRGSAHIARLDDDRLVVSENYDDSRNYVLAIYDISSHQKVLELVRDDVCPEFRFPCQGLDVLPSDTTSGRSALIVSGDESKGTFLWNSETGEKILEFERPCTMTYCARVVPEWNNAIFFGGYGGYGVHRYDAEKAALQEVFLTSTVCSLAHDLETGYLFASGYQDINVFFRKIAHPWPQMSQDDHNLGIQARTTDVLCVPDRRSVLIAVGSGCIQIWDARKLSEMIETFKVGTGAPIFSLSRIDDDVFVSVSDDNVTTFDLTGKELSKLEVEGCTRACGAGTTFYRRERNFEEANRLSGFLFVFGSQLEAVLKGEVLIQIDEGTDPPLRVCRSLLVSATC